MQESEGRTVLTDQVVFWDGSHGLRGQWLHRGKVGSTETRGGGGWEAFMFVDENGATH